jgi:hypothetical protein
MPTFVIGLICFCAGIAVSSPVVAYVATLRARLKVFEAKEAAAAKAELAKVVSDVAAHV